VSEITLGKDDGMTEQKQMLDIYVMGKHYQVPEGLTILTALEYCGYRMIRGCGCRAGFCGACATIYNFKNNPQLKYALACQETVEQDMYLVQIPFFPAAKATYDLGDLEPTGEQVLALYPDLIKCFGCNNCTKSCPQELEVMWYISDALRGDIREVTIKSFDCVMCGLCTARCPQGIAQYNIALLCRRLHGRYLARPSKHLEDRIAEIESGRFDADLDKVRSLGENDLRRLYEERDIEPAY